MILLHHKEYYLEVNYESMAAYIAAGGRAVFTSWNYDDSTVANLAALFGAKYTEDENEDSFTTDLPHPCSLKI